ncbi:MAG: polyprenyl diphosphate synthase [Bacillota bacterium]
MRFFKKSNTHEKEAEKPLSKSDVIEKIQSGEFTVPAHIAFIMDGNGRWAKGRGLSRSEGHKSAENAIKTAVMCAGDFGIKTVTLYAFSTENWSRSEEEKTTIFNLLESFLVRFSPDCVKKGIRVRILGDIAPFEKYGLADSISEIQQKTAKLDKYNLNIALNYGGRQEILQACNKAIALGKQITSEEFENLLYTRDVPDPDFIVRTSGEQRFSNFLLYQSAYSELYFPECLWPDFDEGEFIKAMEVYQTRKRRFGKA